MCRLHSVRILTPECLMVSVTDEPSRVSDTAILVTYGEQRIVVSGLSGQISQLSPQNSFLNDKSVTHLCAS